MGKFKGGVGIARGESGLHIYDAEMAEAVVNMRGENVGKFKGRCGNC